MTFIFDRCHRSLAAVTPAKYERDLKYVTYYCDKLKFSATEELTNGALETPTPGLPFVNSRRLAFDMVWIAIIMMYF